MSGREPSRALATLSQGTGLSPEAIREALALAKANAAVLRGCARHDFSEPLDPVQPLRTKWRCSACGGLVDSSARLWYATGLEHARR